jgi:FkbM family methyltransferase
MSDAVLQNFSRRHQVACDNLVNSVKRLIPPGSVVLDVGSNVGLFMNSVLKVCPDATLHCFEPVKKYYDISVDKFKGTPNVFINNVGLSNKKEEKTIFLDTTNNPGWNTYIEEETQSNMARESTSLITLDEYCKENKLTKIDFIKIDTEGFEAYILEGFLTTLASLEKKPYLLIELGWGTRHPHWAYAVKVFEKLFTMGYKRNDTIYKITGTTDILFEPL